MASQTQANMQLNLEGVNQVHLAAKNPYNDIKTVNVDSEDVFNSAKADEDHDDNQKRNNKNLLKAFI